MEELKPVPPAPKKKPNPILRLLAFLLTLALLLGAVALVAYRDRINLDAIKRYFTYRSLERSDSGQIDAFRFDSSGRGGFSSLGDDLLVAPLLEEDAVSRAVDAALCVMERGVAEAQNRYN